MTTESLQPKSEHPPTLLIVYLHPEYDAGVRYHIDEMLTTAGIPSSLIAQQEGRISLESAAPFIITHNETRMVFALRAPIDTKTIDNMAQLVTIGLILGFVVKGEIALGGEGGQLAMILLAHEHRLRFYIVIHVKITADIHDHPLDRIGERSGILTR